MTETVKAELLHHLDSLDDFQLRIVLGFIKRLFNLD
jgi:hypothetical protein